MSREGCGSWVPQLWQYRPDEGVAHDGHTIEDIDPKMPPGLLSGRPQPSLRHDVLLDLRRPALDRVGDGAEVLIRQAAL